MVSSKEDPHKLLGAGCDKWGDQRLALALVIQKWIEERGLTWFIDGGTLLGAWRNEKFIAHDDDFDIALIMDGDEPVCDLGHMCDSLLAALPSPYMCRIVSSYSDKVEVFDPTQGKYKLTGAQYHGADFHYVTVDLQAYVPRDYHDGAWQHLFRLYRAGPPGLYAYNDCLPVGSITLEGKSFPCPQNTNAFLKTTYGYLGLGARYDPVTARYLAPLPASGQNDSKTDSPNETTHS